MTEASEAVNHAVKIGIGESCDFTVRGAVSSETIHKVCGNVRDHVELCTLPMYHGFDRASAFAFWEREA